MISEYELMKSLYVIPKHECPDGEVQDSLEPPHKGCDWTFISVRTRVSVKESTDWTLADGTVVYFCPWCGAKLPQRHYIERTYD